MDTSKAINEQLKLLTNYDSDVRFMATSDLSKILQDDVRLDEALEKKICLALLKQLDDTSSDVRSVAIKCIAVLVQKVRVQEQIEVLRALTSLIIKGEKNSIDLYSIGMKSCILALPAGNIGGNVVSAATVDLMTGVNVPGPTKLECLDLLSELLQRFGEFMTQYHAQISTLCLQNLADPSSAVRKRATMCLGSLAPVSSESLMNSIVTDLLSQIEDTKKSSDQRRTLVQAISRISGTVGHRLGSHLPRIIPMFLSFMKTPDDESMHNESGDELRENLLFGFESFIGRCPKEAAEYIPKVYQCVAKFVKYDPNYSYDEDESNDEGGVDESMDDDNDDGNIGDDEEYDEDNQGDFDEGDDDTSWKVRNASLRVLNAIFVSRSEARLALYSPCTDLLMKRLKEREENVRVQVISCLRTLLLSTIITSQISTNHNNSKSGDDGSATANNNATAAGMDDDIMMLSTETPIPGEGFPKPSMQRQKSSSKLLYSSVDPLLRYIVATFKIKVKNTEKTKGALFGLLSDLVTVLHGCLSSAQLGALVPFISSGLSDRNSALKQEVLKFLNVALTKHSSSVCQPHINAIFPRVLEAIKADWYKLVAEALHVVAAIVNILRPRIDAEMFEESSFDYSTYVKPMYTVVLPRLLATDIDPEIIECSIPVMAAILSTFGDSLRQETQQALPVFFERLKNETTRLPALRAITELSKSPIGIDFSIVSSRAFDELTSLLRQQSRLVKHDSLIALEAVYSTLSAHHHKMKNSNSMEIDSSSIISDAASKSIVVEASKLISDSDLQLSHLSIVLISTMIQYDKVKITPIVKSDALPKILEVASSPLLSGPCLDSLKKLLRLLTRNNLKGLSYRDLLSDLIQTLDQMPLTTNPNESSLTLTTTNITRKRPFSKKSAESLGECIASICLEIEDKKSQNDSVQEFLIMISDQRNSRRLVAVMSIGSIGRSMDLSSLMVHEVFFKIFEDSTAHEDLKVAAASALGNTAIGNLTFYLPLVMKILKVGVEQSQYLVLSSLREIIGQFSDSRNNSNAKSQLNGSELLEVLEQRCSAPAEGVRNMIAECLGKLALVFPDMVVPHLANGCASSTLPPAGIWTYICAVRYTISSENSPISQFTPDRVDQITQLILHSDLLVRRAALFTLNSIVHHHPSLVKTTFTHQLAPTLLAETLIKPELQRKVDLGPFKHTVDDGLPIRKAAYSVLATSLVSLPDPIWINELVSKYLIDGLKDHPDVQIVCFQIVSQLVVSAPLILNSQIDTIMACWNDVFNKKPKTAKELAEGNSGNDRTNDVLRSALRSLEAVALMSSSLSDSRKFTEFLSTSLRKEAVVPLLQTEFASSALINRAKTPI